MSIQGDVQAFRRRINDVNKPPLCMEDFRTLCVLTLPFDGNGQQIDKLVQAFDGVGKTVQETQLELLDQFQKAA
jgi:hypothetical protein